MAGYIHFNGTGCPEINRLLDAIEHAGDCYHHTQEWGDDSNFEAGEKTHIERIQLCADAAATEIFRLRSRITELESSLSGERERCAALADAQFIAWRSDLVQDKMTQKRIEAFNDACVQIAKTIREAS